ncbi:MAG: hypothetical protein HC929_12155 [Leptolyngbyaceae cyanobacterium SM2_5_2]|nr:hypothetical protein [Leptolyngbyaceae cyanobacterium SM2_5_2]
MTPDDNATKPRTLADIAYSGLLGLALGLVLALLPALVISLSILEWRSSYTALLAGVVVLCGLLGAVGGRRVLNPLMQFLESIPPIV